MQRFMRTRFLAAAVLALGAFGATSAAHARSDLYFVVGAPPASSVYVQPAPVYLQPRPIYVPQRGHYGQDRYQDDRGRHHDTHNWRRRGPYGDHDRDGIANLYDPDSPRNQNRYARRFGPYGDLDRDGIMNQNDRDRDGDGVRNRYDRFPDDPDRS